MTRSDTAEAQRHGALRFLITLLQIALFIPLQLAFVPVAIAGLIVGIYKEMGNRYARGMDVKVFEIDQVNTLKIKIRTLNAAGIDSEWITFVPVDYANESWADKLLEAGFDRDKKTLFLWESVSLFLEEDTVKETLATMADLCADGSIVAQDFYSESFVSGKASKIAKRNASMIGKMGEPWKFGVDMSGDPKAAIESFLNECGLKTTAYVQFGEKLDIEPFYCIVEAEKL